MSSSPRGSTGGAILLIPELMRFDVPALSTYIREKGIEKLILPVVLLQQMAEIHAKGNDDLRFVNEITTTGEQLQISTPIVELFTELDHCRLHNHYGPSESHVVTAFKLDREPGLWSRHPLIGKPIANTQIYLLDSQMSPAPLGVYGELYIGGVSLARGYWARPELTAEKFVPDPLAAEPGARLYRTGDLGRYFVDGNIEYSARIDHQVKVRGFRIELGEIEAVLSRHEAIKETVVLAREDEPGRKQLVAYVVSDSNASLSSNELRRFLSDKLPDYMLPSIFITIDKMPLTANGKIDRRALPRPEIKSDGEEIIDRDNAVEEILSGIWAEVLRLASVGAEQNFFELGGHSLLATQVISRVREAFSVEVPLKALFESPTVAGLAEAVERERGAGRTTEAPPIVAVGRDRQLPLSFAQQRLWFIHQLESDSTAYNLARAVRLRGELDLFALKQSLQAIAQRHEVLRTRFVAVGGQPSQVIDEPGEIELPVWDVSELEASEREGRAREVVSREARRPFDLEVGPVWRAAVAKLSADDHVLTLCTHHIASDGWSTGVMVREFTALYEQYSSGRQATLPELEVQYADYAVWQREWLQGEVLQEQIDYWRNQLEGAPVLELPTDKPRPASASHQGAVVPFTLSAEVSRQLKQVSRRQGVTMFMTLLAAFQVVLSKYSGQDDVVVGTDVANRNRLETEHLIGFFINQLVLRTDLSANPTFERLLASVRETTLSAYQHQDVPFEKLVEELQPERDLSRSPLFQVKLVLQNAPRGELRASGVDFGGFGAEHTAAKFDITLLIVEDDRGLFGMAEYSTELFERTTIERLLAKLAHVAEAMPGDLLQAVSEVCLLSEAEKQQLVIEWNDTAKEYEQGLFVLELFQRQVRGAPDAVAVASQHAQLSYATLNREASRLANYLVGMGVGAEVRVGVCLPRSAEMVIALLGVLKAGGVYVPIDPSYPGERLAYMLDDAQAPVVVTQSRMREKLPSAWVQYVELDTEGEAIRGCSATAPVVDVCGESLAYIIYTSGSTGRPKGVALTHAGMTNLAYGQRLSIEIAAGAAVLQFSSSSFDASIWECTLALINGARLVIGGAEEVLAGDALREVMERERIEVATIPPSVLASVGGVSEGMPRTLIVAGEQCPDNLVREWAEGRQLLDAYGPTETTVCATISRALGRDEQPIIGKPLVNTRVYIADVRGQLMPRGSAGELCIGGVGLARGYWNRPEQTAENFIPDSHGGVEGRRLYRTGDLARWRAGGELEYVGRIDHQVKVRGQRIELKEIETLLGQQTEVRQCAVCVREERGAGKRLVAYVVLGEGAAVSAAELREKLRAKLPEYMVPSTFVELEQMPVTPNGKLDRKALPAPAIEQSMAEADQPRTPVEEILCSIWAELLQAQSVGRQEDFFELGGHSLLATQVISRVREAFDVEVPLRAMFERPTVTGLAELVERERSAGRSAQAPPIVAVGRARQLPLSFAQQRLWFIHQLEPDSAAYNIPIAVRLMGGLDLSALSRSLADIVARHEVLRTRFVAMDGRPIQVIDEPGEIELPVWDLSELEDGEREGRAREVVSREARRGFDLEQGPVWRAAVARLSDDDHVLMLTIHHIASDGWSTGVMVRELTALYDGLHGE